MTKHDRPSYQSSLHEDVLLLAAMTVFISGLSLGIVWLYFP